MYTVCYTAIVTLDNHYNHCNELNYIPPNMYVVPQSVTLFGMRVIADIVS